MSTLFALFLALPTIALPTGNVTAIAPPWVSSPNVRGTADVILTCSATISLCVYTALHLNVPKRGSTRVDNILPKAKWVVVGIFAPEIVVYSAFVQLRTVIVFRGSMRKILQEADLEEKKEYTISSTPETDVLDNDREPITVEGETEGAIKMNAQESDPRMRYMVNGPPTASKEAIFLDNRVSWTYAWYVIMGGFVLNVSPLHDYHGVMTLTHHAMLALAKDGLFLPMSPESIRDKSKADYLAKALVFFQVSFLVVQTIARKSQALPTSLLEIHTLVHVVCAVGMYVAWMRKPLDIQDPTDISLNVWDNPTVETELRWQKAIANILVHGRFLNTWVSNIGDRRPNFTETSLAADYVTFPAFWEREAELISESSTQRHEAQLLDSSFDGLLLKFCTSELASFIIASCERISESQEEKARIKKRFGGPPWNPDYVQDYYSYTSSGVKLPVSLSLMSGCTLSSGVGPVAYPDLLRLHFTKKALKRWLLAFGNELGMGSRPHLVMAEDLQMRWRLRGSKLPYLETRMSSFAAKSSKHDIWTSLLACTTCIIYGGIHAVGWNFIFATQTEQHLWRISCPLLMVLGVPMYSLISALEERTEKGLVDKLKYTWGNMTTNFRFWDSYTVSAFFHLVSFLCFLPYCAARIFLVVEAFISLRHVPEGVYQLVNWTTYIPHL